MPANTRHVVHGSGREKRSSCPPSSRCSFISGHTTIVGGTVARTTYVRSNIVVHRNVACQSATASSARLQAVLPRWKKTSAQLENETARVLALFFHFFPFLIFLSTSFMVFSFSFIFKLVQLRAALVCYENFSPCAMVLMTQLRLAIYGKTLMGGARRVSSLYRSLARVRKVNWD